MYLGDGLYCDVDTETGEVISFYEYVTVPYKPKETDNNNDNTNTSYARDLDSLRAYAKSLCVKASGSLYTYLDPLKDTLKDTEITGLQLCLRDLKYLNISFHTKEELTTNFKLSERNLPKVLKRLVKKGILRYEYIRKHSEYKITWNPYVACRSQRYVREVLQRCWVNPYDRSQDVLDGFDFKRLGSIPRCVIEDTLSRVTKYSENDNELIVSIGVDNEPFTIAEINQRFSTISESKEQQDYRKLLTCSDNDFSLFLKGELEIEDLRNN